MSHINCEKAFCNPNICDCERNTEMTSEQCEVTVYYFKESGKYYTEEKMMVDKGAMPWHLKREMFRLNMTAVIIDGPWGYPHLFY